MAFRSCVVVAAITIALASCSPPHTSRDGNFELKPDPGYAWQDGNSWFNNEVEWKQGLPHPDYPHIHSAAVEGQWTPDDGYGFLQKGSLSVRWQPNRPSRQHRYVVSGEGADTWRPADGFAWTDRANGGVTEFRVTWVPGSRSDRLPNMYAAAQEDHWYPDPGYRIERRADGSLIAVALPVAPPSYYSQAPSSRPRRYAIRFFGKDIETFDTEAGCLTGLDFWRRERAAECKRGGLGIVSCVMSATCHPVY